MNTIKLLTIVLLYLSSFQVVAQRATYDSLIQSAQHYYEQRNYKKSVHDFQLAFKIKTNHPSHLYNAACSSALLGKHELAFEFLEKSLAMGFTEADHLEKDSDLYTLHPLPHWKLIVEKVRKNSTTLTSTAIVKKVEQLIKSNNSDEVIQLLRQNADANIDEYQTRRSIMRIYELLQKNGKRDLGNLSSNTRSSTHITNGITTEGYEKEYSIIPDFLGNRTQLLFAYPLGYEVLIVCEKDSTHWELANVLLNNQYFTPDHDIRKDILQFFGNSTSFTLRFSIAQGDYFFVGTGNKLTASETEFLKTETEIVYRPKEEIQKTTGKWLSLSFTDSRSQEEPIGWEVFSQAGFADSEARIRTLEFIFNETDMNTCLISNGNGYAFYNVSFSGELRKLILRELKRVE